MYKVYLDQKDFSRIASGLIGREGYEEDEIAYSFLLEKICTGVVRVYYSSMHLEEVADYFEDGSEWFTSYIQVLLSKSRRFRHFSF